MNPKRPTTDPDHFRDGYFPGGEGRRRRREEIIRKKKSREFQIKIQNVLLSELHKDCLEDDASGSTYEHLWGRRLLDYFPELTPEYLQKVNPWGRNEWESRVGAAMHELENKGHVRNVIRGRTKYWYITEEGRALVKEGMDKHGESENA